MTGIELITKEREEQLTKHGRSVEWDVTANTNDELVEASLLLIFSIYHDKEDEAIFLAEPVRGWDQAVWNKMLAKDKIGKLAIIGAFAAAEIDRLNYIENHKTKNNE